MRTNWKLIFWLRKHHLSGLAHKYYVWSRERERSKLQRRLT